MIVTRFFAGSNYKILRIMKSSNNKNQEPLPEQKAFKHPYLNRFFQRLSNRDDLLASLTGRHLSPRYFSLGKKRKPGRRLEVLCSRG